MIILFPFCGAACDNAQSRDNIRLTLRRRPDSTTRLSSTTPAASASSSTSRAASRTRSCAGLQVLINLQHRGACGCEANTGDGAGILIQMPDRFLRKVTAPLGIDLPPAGAVRRRARLPAARRRRARPASRQLFERIVAEEGQTAARLARRADRRRPSRRRRRSRAEPVIEQVFIGRRLGGRDRRSTRSAWRFERKLYVIRKRIEHAVDALALRRRSDSCSTSCSLSSQHADLQGDADGRPDPADVPRSDAIRTSSRRSRWCTSASARTRSRRGRSRTRTATSRTTARSTRCAATSTGCAPAKACSGRRCSATICRRSCRSSARAAATRRRSTTCSSSWS